MTDSLELLREGGIEELHREERNLEEERRMLVADRKVGEERRLGKERGSVQF